jgi:hypothetical protein
MSRYRMEISNEALQAFESELDIQSLNESARTAVIATCLPLFAMGYYAAQNAAEKDAKKEAERLEASAKLAQDLDYPGAWDTAAYPNVESAAIEALDAANEEAKSFASRLNSVQQNGFYTMDQMRKYAEGFFTTRIYALLEMLQTKIRECNTTAECLQNDKDRILADSPGAYPLIAAELKTIADNAEALGAKPFQKRAMYWAKDCFGYTLAMAVKERNQRFIEEALELVQSLGMSQREALGAVSYVYGRPAGDPRQEIGGVYNTLAVLCAAHNLDMVGEGERDLLEISDNESTRRIREKRQSKPDFAEVEFLTEAKFLEILKKIPGVYGYMMREEGGGLSPNGIYNLERVKSVLYS